MAWVVAAPGASLAPPDSIGYFLKDGDTIILYEVTLGETLFSIGRDYNLPIEVLRHFNPTMEKDQIREGQILKIPGRGALAKMMNPEVKPKISEPQQSVASTQSHTVALGETLYGIARQYEVKVSDILKANPDLKPDKIREGQVIKIPVAQEMQSRNELDSQSEEPVSTTGPARAEERKPDLENKEESNTAQSKVDRSSYIMHTVERGETMYALSRKYNVKVTEIMEWNDMKTFEIKEGESLIVGMKEEKADIKEQPTEVADIQDPTETEKEMPKAEEPVKVQDNGMAEIEGRENVLSLQYKEDLSSTVYSEKKNNGIATWVRDVEGYPMQQGYFALHKELPIGTVIKVRNLMNSRVVYAKIIGRLPDNNQNDKILLKLPESAKKELHVLDDQLIMEVSYLSRK